MATLMDWYGVMHPDFECLTRQFSSIIKQYVLIIMFIFDSLQDVLHFYYIFVYNIIIYIFS